MVVANLREITGGSDDGYEAIVEFVYGQLDAMPGIFGVGLKLVTMAFALLSCLIRAGITIVV